jgi:hypothetical protein
VNPDLIFEAVWQLSQAPAWLGPALMLGGGAVIVWLIATRQQ